MDLGSGLSFKKNLSSNLKLADLDRLTGHLAQGSRWMPQRPEEGTKPHYRWL
ncbi:hypothetical protein LEMLEM_LOCUS5724 [Lemmus lemmus]